MTIKPAYFDYLGHFGPTITLRELHEDRDRANAVALRHDIDHDLDLALEMAHHEHARGVRATYFLLHTHDYWRDEQFLLKCRQLEAYGHEVALHLNAITEWIGGRWDDVDARLGGILAPLREAGLRVTGTSAHGDRACYKHSFINYWIWRELRGDDPAAREEGRSAEGIEVEDEARRIAYPADHVLGRADGAMLPLWRSSLADHGFDYDAMHVPVDRYWTDTGGGWTRSEDPLEADLSRGRHQVLIHPHWWRGAKRRSLALTCSPGAARWFAGFVDRATSCRGLDEWTLRHRRTEDGMVADDEAIEAYAVLVEDRSRAVRYLAAAAAEARLGAGDVLEANARLEPFLPDLDRLGDGVAFIHLRGDDRAAVRSLLADGRFRDPHDPGERPVPVEGWERLTPFERCCWFVRFTIDSITPFADREIDYERLVEDGEERRRQLAAIDIVEHPLLAAAALAAPAPAESRGAVEWSEAERLDFERICGGTRRADGAAPRELLSFDGGRPDVSEAWVSPSNVSVRFSDRCLELQTREAGRADSNVLLGRGSWSDMLPADGVACDHWAYYVCRVVAESPVESVARIFVLWFDRTGRRRSQEKLATIAPSTPEATCIFAAPPSASHFAIGLHFGAQRPGRLLRLESVRLRSIPMGVESRSVLAPSVRKPAMDHAPVG